MAPKKKVEGSLEQMEESKTTLVKLTPRQQKAENERQKNANDPLFKSRAAIAEYLIKKGYWEFARDENGNLTPNSERLIKAVENNQATVDRTRVVGPKDRKYEVTKPSIITKGTILRVKAMLDPDSIKSLSSTEIPDFLHSDKNFQNVLIYDKPPVSDQKFQNLLLDSLKLTPTYKAGEKVDQQLELLFPEYYKDDNIQEEDDDISIFSRAPTINMRAIDKLEGDQKIGAMYVINKGTNLQQMEFVKELEDLPNMSKTERAAFENKLKRFSNLSKIGDSANQLYAQALLDKRRQILKGNLVYKTKQKK